MREEDLSLHSERSTCLPDTSFVLSYGVNATTMPE